MMLNTQEADKMQSAVDDAFAELPAELKTPEMMCEMAKVVVRSSGDYKAVAQRFAQGLTGSAKRIA